MRKEEIVGIAIALTLMPCILSYWIVTTVVTTVTDSLRGKK